MSRYKERKRVTEAPAGIGKRFTEACTYCGGHETIDNPMTLIGLRPDFLAMHDKCWENWYKEHKSGLRHTGSGGQGLAGD